MLLCGVATKITVLLSFRWLQFIIIISTEIHFPDLEGLWGCVCSTRKEEDEQHWGTNGTMAGKRYLQRGRHCGWLGHLWPLWAVWQAVCSCNVQIISWRTVVLVLLFPDSSLFGQTDGQTVGGLGDLLGIALRTTLSCVSFIICHRKWYKIKHSSSSCGHLYFSSFDCMVALTISKAHERR